METSSAPTLTKFNPNAIPYQFKVIKLLRKEWDYSTGTPEVLLSGSYGSAKSILMAHLAVTHCLFNKGARVLLARKALPDLKDTIFKEILEHIDGELIEGKDYKVNHSSAKIQFSNGSEIISRSWSDKKYKKSRSLKISMAVFEELTENNEEDKEAFMTIKARLRRIPKIKENILIAATNPDDEAHWVHKYFFDSSKRTRFVFKSVTTDNPFLDPEYINQLRQDLDPISVKRYIYGEWVSISKDKIYYNYTSAKNFINQKYVFDHRFPVSLFFDFNIGFGKPMSAGVGQEIDGVFHIARVWVIEGTRTLGMMEEMAASDLFENNHNFMVYGDASGKSNDTRSIKSDYEIIKDFLARYIRKDGSSLKFSMHVPLSNPPIRKRHNLLNGLFENDLKKVSFFVYNEALVADEGLRLTKLRKGADYIEDDSDSFQHITTAIGYWCHFVKFLQRETNIKTFYY